jgi:SEC-C motif domain protein
MALSSAVVLWVITILLCEAPLARSLAVPKNKSTTGRNAKKVAAPEQHRGFGKAPPSLEETIASFKTRKPPPPHETLPCPCGQFPDRTYGECCGPYHKGIVDPMTPLDVLRTRYSAFCWRDVEYVIRTTHPTCRDFQKNKVAWAKDLDRNGMFDSYDFVGLTVLGEQELTSDNEGIIEFEVKLRANSKTSEAIAGQTSVVKERSRFLRDPETKIWSYASGDVSASVYGADDVVLNR